MRIVSTNNWEGIHQNSLHVKLYEEIKTDRAVHVDAATFVSCKNVATMGSWQKRNFYDPRSIHLTSLIKMEHIHKLYIGRGSIELCFHGAKNHCILKETLLQNLMRENMCIDLASASKFSHENFEKKPCFRTEYIQEGDYPNLIVIPEDRYKLWQGWERVTY